MGNMATENAAGARISSLLDAGSFVEIGGAVDVYKRQGVGRAGAPYQGYEPASEV